MSESANPLVYFYTAKETSSGRTQDRRYTERAVALDTSASSHKYGPLVLYRDQLEGPTAITILEEQAWGEPRRVTLDGVELATTDLPIATQAFTEPCLVGRDVDFLEEKEPCNRPVRAWINGWSAGPIPMCEKHLAELGMVQDESPTAGIWWRPVEVTLSQLDQIIAAEAEEQKRLFGR